MATINVKSRVNLLISVIFIFTGILIGLLLTMQFKSSIPSTSYPADELEAQQELMDSFVADQALLKNKIVTIRGEIEVAQEEAKSIVQEANLETLKSLKKAMGLELVRGEGIEITLNDGLFVDRESSEEVSQSMIHASDLRDIVNILRTAKADAIAINDQRIIASTPITSVGNTILVNNFHLLPPFTVMAVGDQELLLQRLNDQTSLPDIQKRVGELKIQFNVETNDGVSIPVYNGNLSSKYINEFTDSEL